MTVKEHSAAVTIQWLRECGTMEQLRRRWTEELTDYSRGLPGVKLAKDKRKGEVDETY